MSKSSEKSAAAIKAVDDWLKDGQVIGMGSGTTAVFIADYIALRVRRDGLTISCIPTSYQARHLILQNGLKLSSLDENPEIDVTFDGIDEIDSKLTCIKGGGGCLLQEKIVASCSNNFVVIGDSSKISSNLGDMWTRGIPIEVVPFAAKPVGLHIEKALSGEALLRKAVAKMGPVITDNGNFILDWKFDRNMKYSWREVDSILRQIPGVVETGLFIDMVKSAYIAQSDGTLKVLYAKE